MSNANSIVLELQRLATAANVDIGELLRKALVVATKLGVPDFREWITNELNGYKTNDVPAYRVLKAELTADNPYHGLIPFIIQNARVREILCNVPIGMSIGALQHLLRGEKANQGVLEVPLNAEQTTFLMEAQEEGLELPPVRTIGRNQVAGVLDVVRNTILQWALRLESQGIIGEGMSFTDKEKRAATGNTQIRIENFQGILGDVHRSKVTQQLSMNLAKGDIDGLKARVRSLGIGEEDIQELESALAQEPQHTRAGKFGPKVSSWMGRIVSKAASGACNMAMATASEILARLLSAYYGLPS